MGNIRIFSSERQGLLVLKVSNERSVTTTSAYLKINSPLESVFILGW